MALPPEVLTTSMRAHQKYFACLDRDGKLAPRFLWSSPTWIADDGGKAIVAGNERVLRARLSDAQFFWDQDRKVTLAARIAETRRARLSRQARQRASTRSGGSSACAEDRRRYSPAPTGARCGARRELAKADLSTGMVGEFPELQGIMGRYYALHDGEAPRSPTPSPSITRRSGRTTAVPRAPVSVAVALADKIDTLVGFFAIDEKPTGSQGPLRAAPRRRWASSA